jgi:hypothetical protein
MPADTVWNGNFNVRTWDLEAIIAKSRILSPLAILCESSRISTMLEAHKNYSTKHLVTELPDDRFRRPD